MARGIGSGGDETGEEPVEQVLANASLDGDGSLTQQVYRLMWNLIVELRLLPNQYLSEKDVAVLLKVSRTPVREAFVRLAEDGLLNIRPKSGSYVSPIDTNRAYEAYLIRSSLEATCAARLAKQHDAAIVKALQNELRKQKAIAKHNDYSEFHPLDVHFHEMLFTSANLPNMKRLVDAAKFEADRIKNVRRRFSPSSRTLTTLYDEHAAIVNAIASAHAGQAAKAVVRHLSDMNAAIESIARDEKFWGMFHEINNGKKQGKRIM